MPRSSTLLLFLVFTACSLTPEVVNMTAVPGVTEIPASATAAEAASPTEPVATTTSAPVALTETPAPTGTATAAPLQPVTCSPLRGYELAELPEIVSQPFIAPRPGLDDGHHGADFAHYAYGDKTTIAGAPVQAMFAGVVAAAVADSWPYGNFVIVESQSEHLPPDLSVQLGLDGRSLYHLYAHLEEPPVGLEIGAPVDSCELLGSVGNTGWSGNYHLHLETRPGPSGMGFSEMAYYQTTTTETERANYERWRFGGEFVPLDPILVLGALE